MERRIHMDLGWIRFHPGLFGKPIRTAAMLEQKVILITLLMMANQGEKQREWKGQIFTVRPGHFDISLPSSFKNAEKNSSDQKIRMALIRFVKYEFLTDESTPHNRRITIINWRVYQGLDEIATVTLTDEQQMANRQLTANKNLKTLKT